MKQIAALLDVSETFLGNRFADDERVRKALSLGQARAALKVSSVLYSRAVAGDMTAIIWWEKTREKRSDRMQVVTERDVEDVRDRLSALPDELLDRIANGESPAAVLGRD